MKYFALLTKLGENLLAQATALGTKLELTHMAVGDGGGSLPTPDTNQTKLIDEKRRAAINTLFIDEQNKNQIIAEQIIPEQDGGWWIREIGLFDKAGNLIAVANCPETYKPQLAEGSGRTQSIRMVLIVSHTESVTLKIDPSVVLATREYVNTEITVLDKKIDALSAQTKLDLNKKFDKANISGAKGNDNDKVPSLNLFTTEIGKLAALGYSYSKIESDGRYQPKGNYAPAGDYATNTALNNGLNGKLDKTVVVQDVGTSTTKVMSQDASFKKFMKFGDYGFGSLDAVRVTNSQLMSSLQSQLFRMGGGSDDNAFVNHGAGLLISYSSSIRAGLFIDDANGDLTVFRSRDNIASGAIRKNKVYTDGNTATDRNGYLRVVSSVEELVGVPVGGSILWNGVWDGNSPLAEYFWPNEGRSFSAVAYPVAAKVFPSLRLPDDRGYAIRIADNGRGIDPGRTVGTYQEDAMQKIEGTLGPLNDRAISYTGAFYGKSKTGSNAGINGGGQENVAGFDSSRVVRTANETRMKNVAKILITRMK
ncbi:phage tail protein [Providencia rettgeri]